MVLVFGSFILGGQRIIELFGVGLAGAVALDALIVRAVLVPALMMMIGPRNWSFPGRLERFLPRLNVEGGSVRPAPAPAPASAPVVFPTPPDHILPQPFPS
jgi:RND superfamily putative drug exporter